MSDPVRRRARVILGATCYADAEPGLQIAVLLAQSIGANIEGCLVADEAAIAAASLPRARSVSLSGQPIPSVDAGALMAAFRADARLFEHRLLDAARHASLQSAFQQARGALTGVLEGLAAAEDVIVYGMQRMLRSTARRDAPLVLVATDSVPGTGILKLAVDLARRMQTRLVVLAESTFVEEVRAALDALPEGTAAEVAPITAETPLLTRVDRMSPAAVLLGGGGPGMPPVPRLIEAARCPVILPMQEAV